VVIFVAPLIVVVSAGAVVVEDIGVVLSFLPHDNTRKNARARERYPLLLLIRDACGIVTISSLLPGVLLLSLFILTTSFLSSLQSYLKIKTGDGRFTSPVFIRKPTAHVITAY
jgi:hypothetical protein